MMILRHVPPRKFDPVAYPAEEALSAAWKVVGDQALAVYQRLYLVGLSSPGFEKEGTPFYSHRSLRHAHCVEVGVKGRPEYTFFVRTKDEVDTVVEKTEKIYQATQDDIKKIDPRVCCPFAMITGCVCALSYTCWLHGHQCIGTHD